MRSLIVLSLATLSLSLSVGTASAAEPVLHQGDHLAICGDSITEQKMYSRYIAAYLAASQPQLQVDTAQFGWGGERAPGFAGRLARSLSWFKPTVATTCYGMNDGGYRAYAEDIGKAYVDGMKKILAGCTALGVRTVVVGSPGAVDTTTYRRTPDAAVYNPTLAALRDRAHEVATEAGFPFADVHQPMIDAMSKAKAAYGEAYHVGGGDGVHPQENGQVIMAYAFLKALAVDGDIARIELNMAGTAKASPGHRVVKSGAGTVTIESSRYPYLLGGSGNTPNQPVSIAPFVPFLAELSRFTLVVPDCAWAQARVTWGEGSALYTREQLAAGINLSELPKTPFDAACLQVDKAVGELQGLETFLVKSVLCMATPAQLKTDAGFTAAQEVMTKSLIAKRAELVQAVRASVQPVTHTITVTQP